MEERCDVKVSASRIGLEMGDRGLESACKLGFGGFWRRAG